MRSSAAEVTLATREVSLGKRHPDAILESLPASPDSKRMAYVAKRRDKLLAMS
jgi:hypothetical protein